MYRVEYEFSYSTADPLGYEQITLRLYMRHGASQFIDIAMGSVNEDESSGIASTTSVSACFYAFSTIERVGVYMKAATSSPIRRQSLSLKACLASSESVDKEVTIVSVRGVPDGVTYSVGGRLNYEYIPGAELKPDLSR